MRHITELEDDIKSGSLSVQQEKSLLIKEKLLVIHQLSLQQTPENYKNLNDMMLALNSAEKIIETLIIRYKK
ncbi:TPA: EscE/YscE/SsaE family type III secretion system needle protein co-chaperone [Yersinia enterocolitica]|uniref:EscE/YscE/SsaE family type III secretion system needle protein co-chaperone n=1 Tax=Yersinia enterocolitica TaxID=630 RepID=UPI00094BB1F5|nr:EscE/YscE/SsaE family type III secretion system needle protein co-chaperone [Yersinia enterocolitica]HDM8437631.1 EscE/YscE/SsaE family type III secretion system needle protein co-chaperone [Yersinia enterocolitica]HEI6851204.1 EscE/YscE/SsaE family type III secretion system needle protein co-chaperone [Yersinia enterocolitica]HEN3598904.1 EscE/YscE/SsaE family type III secretion system needle protein co-chaperone [Yersinia enterocolitica]HEN3603000.1 EscE/YscE/SsaE family type III secretion